MSPFSVWADRRETRSYLAELMSEMVNVEEKSWESAIFFSSFLSFFFRSSLLLFPLSFLER